jgi:hypothetical protein
MSKLRFYWFWPQFEWADHEPQRRLDRVLSNRIDDRERLNKGYAILATVVE